jgi:ribosome-associated protein
VRAIQLGQDSNRNERAFKRFGRHGQGSKLRDIQRRTRHDRRAPATSKNAWLRAVSRKRRNPLPSGDESGDTADAGDPDPRSKSKSQIKRELAAVQRLAVRLLEISADQLDAIPLGDDTREAVSTTRNLERRARQRQLRFTSGLLAREDLTAVELAFEQLLRPHNNSVRAFHQVEQWRDELLSGKTALIDELGARYPRLDRQRLVQLVREALREGESGRPPRAARQLFRFLAELEDD